MKSQHEPTLLRNAFTVDVEEYFQVYALASRIQKEQWPSLASRLQPVIEQLLELLSSRQMVATFFILGWVARRLPHVVQAIAAAGHEIASHGMEHQRVDHMNAAQFLADATTSKALLEEVSGQVVVGFRAPNYSMGRDNLWAHAVLAEAGYRYSSSIYPIRHDHYGMAESPVTPWHPHPQGVVEIPVAALPWWGVHLPVGGGGYFRFYPYFISRWLLQRFNQQHGSAVFFIHPWELDATQPVVLDLPWRSRFRHYLNLHRTQDRLQHLLDDFHWTSIQQLHGHRWQVKR